MSRTIRNNRDYPNGHIPGFGSCKRVRRYKLCPGGGIGLIFTRMTPQGTYVKRLRNSYYR